MLKLRVVQARYGDCLILESGAGKRRKYILVDGGPDQVYGPYLKGQLASIAAGGGQLDLVVLSHVDNDHVLGLLELMDDLQNQPERPLIKIGAMWHNGFSKLVPEAQFAGFDVEQELLYTSEALEVVQQAAQAAEPQPPSPGLKLDAVEPLPEEANPALVPMSAFGIREGRELQLIDSKLGIPRNPGFPDELITLETAPNPRQIGRLKLWLLGPNQKNLDRLRKKWQAWLSGAGLSFDLKKVRPDTSETNLSSIMFLAEEGRRRILMTGDGRSEDIIAGLEQAGLMLPGGTFAVDILKVPHHGSARNVVGELFDRVLAKTYVFSAQQYASYNNPDLQTLHWLVDAACCQNRDITIFVTNSTPAIEQIQLERPPSQNHYTLRIMQGPAEIL